jgi:hypothetical protein
MPAGITTAWCGAAYDSDAQELLYVANGGHGDYAGNEAYALALWSDSPYWYRLTDPTPSSLMNAIYDNAGSSSVAGYPQNDATTQKWPHAVYRDGRSRAMHTSGHPVYVPRSAPGGGRVWFPVQSSIESGSGGPSLGVVSFNRYHEGTPTNRTQRPLPHPGTTFLEDAKSAGPWACHGVVNNRGYYATGLTFGYSWLAPDGKIWTVGGYSEAAPTFYVDPATGHGEVVAAGNFSHRPVGVALCEATAERPSPVLIAVMPQGGDIYVFDISARTWSRKSCTGSSPNIPIGNYAIPRTFGGATGHRNALYFLAPQFHGGTILKLNIPTSASTFNSATWPNAWTTVPGSTTGGPPNDTEGGTYSRARVVTFDRAGDVAVMVFNGGESGGYAQPTHVFRLIL